jgi:nucleoside-diphosphate-sugar epimerase
VYRFIYCSSSSVYGVSESPDVTEEHPLVPLTLYNKYKGMCEPLLFKHQSPDFVCVTIRPATLCGYAPRQRLDLSVNILTNHAVNNRKITVFGGAQKRPNLHVQDMVDLYKLLLDVPDEKIAGQTFNAGFQNMSIMEIARIVKRVVEEIFPEKGDIPIVTTPTDDIRSYHVNSDKIRRVLGFEPKRTVEDAVRDLCAAFKAGKLPDSMNDTFYFNVRRLKEINAK